MLRIGFAGSGLIAWTHAIGLGAMIQSGVVEAEISAIYDVDREKAARLAGASNASVSSSVDELIENCDAVWVCTPTAAHLESVIAAASAGRPVFCEKPLATDLDGATLLAQAVADSGVAAQVGLVLRTAPVFPRTVPKL